MFQNDDLKNHLETSYSVSSQSAVVAEWNMNIPGNIKKIGNYRFRKGSTKYSVLPNFFDIQDSGDFYTGATDSTAVVESGFKEDSSTPQLFTYNKDKEKMLYSLEDCLKPFRPRSGINKMSYFGNKYLPFENKDMFLRPRYYMPTKDDEFKYWRSYRTESDTSIYQASVISATAILSQIAGSSGAWTGVLGGLSSTLELPVGKVLAASSNTKVSFGTSATISNIVQVQAPVGGANPVFGIWTATLTLSGTATTAGLLIGDVITATDGTGKLGDGAPQSSIVITAITSSTSLTYTVQQGTGPVAGIVLNPETVPGNLGTGEVKVLSKLSPSSITVSIASKTTPTAGSLKNIYVNKYQTNIEYGISKNGLSRYEIDDANPFVVYKEQVPANRIIVKVQTNIGSIDLGPFRSSGGLELSDPFFGDQNKTTPKIFKVQYLDPSDQWIDAYSFNDSSLRDDQESPIFGADGYLSLEYGIQVPEQYKNNFMLLGTKISEYYLPSINYIGAAYIVSANKTSKGTLYIFNGNTYDTYIPEYKWSLGTDGVYENTHFVTDFTDPSYYNEIGQGANTYREFVWVKGLRLAVETMNVPNAPLELIELSPRLVANMTDLLTDFEVTKAASDLSGSALPVGQLLAGVGSVSLFDNDNSFNPNNEWNFSNNSGSIISKYSEKNIKFTFYDIIKNVKKNNYYVPIKTMYSEGFPERDARTGSISISLRDFYFYLESIKAPRILLTDVSLSQAVCILLDSIGFSNYVFKRLDTHQDPIIPYFFIPPEQSVAETLNMLAKATQSAMFFDEYNNFVVMTKEYLLDETNSRLPDMTLYGSNTSGKLANIAEIAAQDKKVYNAGTVNYTARHIKKTPGTIAQNRLKDNEYIYNPSLLWEVAGSENTASAQAATQESYALAAVPLNTNLTNKVPTVNVAREIIDNTIDIGENAYWLARFKGFLYANGEIIKYDAVEYSIPGIGNTWISSNIEYQKYFSKIPFNGKIYPTGMVRIYAEPYYETFNGITVTQDNVDVSSSIRLKTGPVVSHGRAQFGTKIPDNGHQAGLDPYWSNNDNIQGCEMQSEFLYSTSKGLVITRDGVNTNGSTKTEITVKDIGQLAIGQTLNILGGTGVLSTQPGGTKITAINTTINEETKLYTITISPAVKTKLVDATVKFAFYSASKPGVAGLSKSIAEKTQRNGIIRNFISSRYATETEISSLKTTTAGTIQSSALVMTGPDFEPGATPRDFVSYVYRDPGKAFKHFGTRVRIIGKIESSGDRAQSVVGGMTYFNVNSTDPTKTISVGGGSSGIALVNPNTNNGYFFEIAALTASNIEDLLDKDTDGNATVSIENILFYKVKRNVDETKTKAIPERLWGGIGNILVDDGNFAGQYRIAGEENPTVYDLAIEYVDVNERRRDFYLYINQKLVARVVDDEPLTLVNSKIGLFVRGTSKAMFENIYALSKNYATNAVFDTNVPLAPIFGDSDNQVNASEALSRYAMTGMVQSTYLSGISASGVPAYDLYFEEFGTILRECAYFNIKYDRSYPALYAKIAPTFNRIKGYTVSGFMADSYGAEFLVFNNTDTAINLDASTGNYLRILGITFTQDTTNTITIDDYLKKKGNLANPELTDEGNIDSPYKYIEQYDAIRQSRILYGKNDFTLDSLYIQDADTAEEIIGWIINKNMRPRKSVGLKLFSAPILQLGDMVNINFKDNDGIDLVSPETTKFVVYNINYSRGSSGPEMTVHLSEV